MAQTITFEHPSGGFDFVSPDDLEGRESLGEREVAVPLSSGGGTRTAHKVEAAFVRTNADFPDDYDADPQAVTHYVQTLTDQHSTADKITTVYGPAKLARKFAALLDAEYGGETAPELEQQLPLAAATTATATEPTT